VSRVIAYVDGFNLYFGIKSKQWRRYYWLDVAALATVYLKPGQRLMETHYFTTRIRDNGRNVDDRRRQNTYIDAVRTRGATIHEGHYLEKTRTCRKCGAVWTDYEEKMTDVNIAVQLFGDALDDRFDVALLVSGDSDLTTPLARLRQRFPHKRLIVLLPPNRHSRQLQQIAHGYVSISENKLRASQLPDPVVTTTGYPLRRPPGWA